MGRLLQTVGWPNAPGRSLLPRGLSVSEKRRAARRAGARLVAGYADTSYREANPRLRPPTGDVSFTSSGQLTSKIEVVSG
jgi:hypothetical protein